MANKPIGLLFGVSGGASVTGETGRAIQKDLRELVDKINKSPPGSAYGLPAIKLQIDTGHILEDLKKINAELQNMAKIKGITFKDLSGQLHPQGKSKKGMRGSALSDEASNYKQLNNLVTEYHRHLTEVSNLQRRDSSITQTKRGVWKTSDEQYAIRIKQMNDVRLEYNRLMKTMTSGTRRQRADTLGISLKHYDALLDSIIAKDARWAAASEKDTSTVQATARIQKYNELNALVSQYYSNLTNIKKLLHRDANIEEKDGVFTTENKAYTNRLEKMNELSSKYRELEALKESKLPQEQIAQKLGISVEQYKQLINTMIAKSKEFASQSEKDFQAASASFSGWADKAHRLIRDSDLLKSKKPGVSDAALKVEDIIKTGDVRRLDELKTKFADLQRIVRESGADVESWGRKFVKTFSARVRSLAAGAIIGMFTRGLHDIINNVKRLDTAMRDLQIASGKNREEVRALIKDYSRLAQEIGATTTEVARGADTWLRQGYAAKDANTLIKNSTMLSKLGQIEAAEAAKNLTSAMKGYKVSVEDSIGIVDKFTAVDMAAAASAGDIATAMAQTATGASLAGVSMDRLIGYLTVVKEVTQDNSETVGRFYKTLFARIGNVKAGKFVDEESGEALNDVEKVLGKLGIHLRDNNGLFRNTGEVLDEVGKSWASYDNVQQHAIATAFAGTRQQEKFIVLMENYENALKYSSIAAESGGTALEKYEAHLNSVAGKQSALKAALEGFSVSLLSSDLVGEIYDLGSGLLNLLTGITELINKLGGLKTVLMSVASILVAVKGKIIFAKILSFIHKLSFAGIISQLKNLRATLIQGRTAWMNFRNGTMTATEALQASSGAIGLAMGALTLIIAAISAYNNHVKEMAAKTHAAAEAAADNSKEVTDLTLQYLALTEAVDKGAASKEGLSEIEDTLIKKLHLEKKALKEVNNEYRDNADLATSKAIRDIQEGRIDILGDLTNAERALLNDADIKKHLSRLYVGNPQNVVGEANKEAITFLRSIGYINADGFKIDKNKVGSFGIDLSDYDLNTVDGIISAYNKMEDALIRLEEQGLENTGIYKALSSQRRQMAEQVDSYTDAIDRLNNSVAQENVLLALQGKALPSTKYEFEQYRNGVIQAIKESEKFIGTEEEIAAAVDNILKSQKGFMQFYERPDKDTPIGKGIVELKDEVELLEEVRTGYDALSSAMEDMANNGGKLSAASLKTLLDLLNKNGLAGLKFEDILVRDANGYHLAANSLQKYCEALIELYTIQNAPKTLQDRENAIANLEMLMAILVTLKATTNDETDATKEATKALEEQKKAREDELDSYRKLIDIRKKLLNSYIDERKYKKELSEKETTVANLRTALQVAQLDTSARGQAKAREIENKLREAESELEDFTLEHAVDVLINDIDQEYEEYESFIQKELDTIADKIDELNEPKKPGEEDNSWIDILIDKLRVLIDRIGEIHVSDESGIVSKPVVIPRLSTPVQRFATSSAGAHGQLWEPTGMKASGAVTNNYNQPLISLNISNVNKDTLPDVEDIVDKAAKRLKQDMDNGMKRNGYRRSVTLN